MPGLAKRGLESAPGTYLSGPQWPSSSDNVVQLDDDNGPASSSTPQHDPEATAPASIPSETLPKLITTTRKSAPDGTPNHRLKVGVGEEVEVRSDQDNPRFEAPPGELPLGEPRVLRIDSASRSTISLLDDDGRPIVSKEFTAVEPEDVEMEKTSELIYSADAAGSGFVAKPTLKPKSVNFEHLKIQEQTAPAAASGFYERWQDPHPAGSWKNVSFAKDTIGLDPEKKVYGPYEQGQFTWKIPWKYEWSGEKKQFAIVEQSSKMADASGLETTSKGGASRQRKPDSPREAREGEEYFGPDRLLPSSVSQGNSPPIAAGAPEIHPGR